MSNPTPTGRPTASSDVNWLTGQAGPAAEPAQQTLMDMASRLSFTVHLDWLPNTRPDYSAMAALAADIAATLNQHGASGIGFDAESLLGQMASPQPDAMWNAPEVPDAAAEAAMAQALLQAGGGKPPAGTFWFT